MRGDGPRPGTRAQSTTVGYVLSVAIATILVAGLIAGMGTFVTDEQREAARGQMRVIGERVAAKLMAVDVLATANGGTVYVEPTVPPRVVNTGYRVAIVVDGGQQEIHLSATRLDVHVVVPFTTETPVVESSTTGSDFAVRYDGSVIRIRGERP